MLGPLPPSQGRSPVVLGQKAFTRLKWFSFTFVETREILKPQGRVAGVHWGYSFIAKRWVRRRAAGALGADPAFPRAAFGGQRGCPERDLPFCLACHQERELSLIHPGKKKKCFKNVS